MRIVTTLVALVTLIASCRVQREPSSEIRSLNSTIEDGEPAVYKIVARYPVLDAAGQQVVNANGVKRFVFTGCTMTAYSRSHGISAAHCVVNDQTGQVAAAGDIRVYFRDNSYGTAKKVTPHPGWITKRRDSSGNVTTSPEGRPSDFDTSKDLSVIEFDEQFTDFKKLSPQAPAAGDPDIKIVGFGLRGFYETMPVHYIMDLQLSQEQKDFRERVAKDNAAAAKHLDDFRNAYQNVEANKASDSDPLVIDARRLKAHIKQIEESLHDDAGRFIKRSGATTLRGIASSIRDFKSGTASPGDDELLIFTGKFLDSVFKDKIDTSLFENFGVYAPDENTDSSASGTGLAASFGDSGGPLLSKGGHLIGVSSHVNPDIAGRTVESAYVNLFSKNSKAFFASLKADGWVVPEAAAEQSDSNPPGDGSGSQDNNNPQGQPSNPGNQPPANGDPQIATNQNLAAALASNPDPSGNYHLLISAGLETNSVWICQGASTLAACASFDKATHTATTSSSGPSTRYNFQSDMPVNILQPFAIMTETPGGLITGVIVKGAKK